MLLADLALHLVQAAIVGEQMRPDLLKRYLYSILTIAQDYLPEINLSTAEQLLSSESVPAASTPVKELPIELQILKFLLKEKQN